MAGGLESELLHFWAYPEPASRTPLVPFVPTIAYYTADKTNTSSTGQTSTSPSKQQYGQNNNVAFFSATCPAGSALGDVVMINDDGSVIQADSNTMQQAIGVITYVMGTQAIVQTTGNCTVFSGLVTGAAYFVGHVGKIVTPPLPANDILYAQSVGTAVSPTTLYLNMGTAIYQRILT